MVGLLFVLHGSLRRCVRRPNPVDSAASIGSRLSSIESRVQLLNETQQLSVPKINANICAIERSLESSKGTKRWIIFSLDQQ